VTDGFSQGTLGSVHVRQEHLGVVDQDFRLRRESDPAAGWLEEANSGLALEGRELLRDGRRAEGHGLGNGGDGAAPVKLAQQPESMKVEHCFRVTLQLPFKISLNIPR
jgi:hypothetical protein